MIATDTDTADLDNRPLLLDFDADWRTKAGADFPWYSVETCIHDAAILETRRDAEEAAR